MEKKSPIQNQNLIDKIVNSLPHYIFWKDVNLVFQGCNLKFAKQFGYENENQIIGQTDKDFPWTEKNREKYRKDDLFVINTGRSLLNIEEKQDQPDGSAKYVLVSKVPLRDENDNITGILGIYTDVTQRKKQEKLLNQSLEQAKQANKSKSEFIANMSHDLRTPITGMLGMVQDIINTADQAASSLDEGKLQQQDLKKTLKTVIETVQRDGQLLMSATDELLQLCNEILEVVSLESGKLDNNVEAFSLHELVEHNIELLKPVAHHKKLQLLYAIDPKLPEHLKGRRIYLDRILLNLISNALKFTEEGFVTVWIIALDEGSTNNKVGDTITLQISVKDTGIGIPKDKFDMIFEHFFRLTPAYEGLYKGAGLGLYTVKRYVKAMQGTIKVESEVNYGTCFTVTLPFIVSDHTDRSKQSVRFTKTMKSPVEKPVFNMQECVPTKEARASILIVEDQSLAAYAITLALKPFDCHIELAENGLKALTMAQESDYDLILIDIGLPDISGIDVTKKIRAFKDPKKSHVPIVALTGHANNPKLREEAIDAGMQEVMSKPAQPLALKAILQEHVFKEKTKSLAVIDWDACVQMCNGDPEFTRKMLAMLAEDLKKTKIVLAEAYTRGDKKTLLAELHRACGGVCYLKVPQLEHALRTLNETAKEELTNKQRLKSAYEALQQAMHVFWNTWESEF